MDDSKIIELFHARSEQAIMGLSQKYGAVCIKIAKNILNNKLDAEECVNDAYLGAWNTIPPQNPSVTLSVVRIPNDREQISNQIPEWVSNAECVESLYAITSENIEQFNTYAEMNFPQYCGVGWTQKQSDSVYLGQGIEMFLLDNSTQINRIIYYPVVLNGVIVSGFQVCENLDNSQMSFKTSPQFVNELNVLMSLTDENTPLVLGSNNNNVIAIIGDTYYVLEKDHIEHKEVDVAEIPNIVSYTCVNAMESFCTERTANVSDWVIVQ